MILVLKYFGPDFKKQPPRVTFPNYTLTANLSLSRNINMLCHRFLPSSTMAFASYALLSWLILLQTDFVIQY